MGLKVKKSPDNFVIVSNSKTSTTHCKQKTFRRLSWFKCWEQWSVYFEKLLNRSHLKWPARCREVFSSFNLKLGIVLTTYRCNYNVAATRDSDLKSSQFLLSGKILFVFWDSITSADKTWRILVYQRFLKSQTPTNSVYYINLYKTPLKFVSFPCNWTKWQGQH